MSRRPVRRRRPTKLTAWQRSQRFRDIGSAAITEWNRKRAAMPKCGAAAKSTGEPCRQLALGNGRCQYHGGRTPSGEQWHKTAWPNGAAPDAELKLSRKLKNINRAEKKRAAKVAAMTPGERERYALWHQTHKPGAASARAAARDRKAQKLALQSLLSEPVSPEDPEAVELTRRIAELEAKRDALTKYDIFG